MKENKFLQNDYGLAYVNPHGIGYKCESFQVRFPHNIKIGNRGWNMS